MATPKLLLSLFPGIDLLGRGFELEGYHVVRGPDLLWGQAIEDYTPPADAFEGIIAGPPCQDFSRARRVTPRGTGVAALTQFTRVVTAAAPEWWLVENVPCVPDVQVAGYTVQRFNLRASECGCQQARLRAFQFGSRDGMPLVIRRPVTPPSVSQPACMASEGAQRTRRDWATFCQLQGLPADFDLPGWSLAAKYRAVGNGVPIPMARVVAAAVRDRAVTAGTRLCTCACGRPVSGKQSMATPACRKRMERRRRDAAGVTGPGSVTEDLTQAPEALYPNIFEEDRRYV